MKPDFYKQQFSEIGKKAGELEKRFEAELTHEQFQRALQELMECYQKYNDVLDEIKGDSEALSFTGDKPNGRIKGS